MDERVKQLELENEALLTFLKDVSTGRYLDSCVEKRAQAYTGLVLMARVELKRQMDLGKVKNG